MSQAPAGSAAVPDEDETSSRNRILKATAEVLARNGQTKLSLSEVALQAGVSRPTLYRWFASKEELAAATMRWLQQRTLEELDRLDADPALAARDRLEGLLRWAVDMQMNGRMPTLPSRDSALTEVLTADAQYMELLDRVGSRIVAWIEAAQRDGDIDPAWPSDVLLMTVFARACDPVPLVLKGFGHDAAAIADWAVKLLFNGLAPPARRPARRPASR